MCSLRDLEKEAGAAGLAPPLREGEAGDGRVRGTIQYLVQHEVRTRPAAHVTHFHEVRLMHPGVGKPCSCGVARVQMEKKVERMNSSKYVSGARSTLRLMWFLDFLCTFITRLLEDKEELRDSASAAYDEALAPHHPWLVRKTVHGAMYFVPHKATFWHNLAGTDDRSVIAPVMAAALEKMQILRQQLWAYYGEHKLTDLP
ncbi:hypothetical protein EON66_09935 [archaeon]|nr:MAG: hypothetical protein EON66_09935 [archaeon]